MKSPARSGPEFFTKQFVYRKCEKGVAPEPLPFLLTHRGYLRAPNGSMAGRTPQREATVYLPASDGRQIEQNKK